MPRFRGGVLMPGVRGSGGPTPKRSDRRLGHTSKASRERASKAAAASKVSVPRADPEWHPVAKQLYESLKKSGQAQFFEASDWGTAWLLAESISRELSPQPMVVGKGEHAQIEMVELPPKGASLAAWLKGLSSLLATEGDRRRLRLELERPKTGKEGEAAGVSWLDDARRRRESG